MFGELNKALADLPVAGYTKLSTIDWPGKLAAVVYLAGCPLSCAYCHNKARMVPVDIPGLGQDIASRVGIIDGVVISGGEPMIHPPDALRALVYAIKARGLQVKLDTSGVPVELNTVFGQACHDIDYVAMDLKAPSSLYELVTMHDVGHVRHNVDCLAQRDPGTYEFRTTVHKELLSENDLMSMRDEWIDGTGAVWYLQQFRKPPEGTLCEILGEPYSDNELLCMADKLGARTRGIRRQ